MRGSHFSKYLRRPFLTVDPLSPACQSRRRSRKRQDCLGVRLFVEPLEDRITPSLGTFELDGNATTQTTHDWDQVYNDAVLHPGQNTSGSIPGAVAFVHDPVNSTTDNIFTGGGSKDINDVNQWHIGQGTPQSKADIADAYAAAYQVQVGGQTHTVIDFGADRYDNSASTTLGFWFFQNPISVNADGSISGAHAVGDILVVADNNSGSVTINAYRWVGPGGSTGALQLLTPDPTNLFGIVNTSNTPSGGWPFTDKSGTTPANTFAPGEFAEGGIDLTDLGLPNSLSSFVVETRASTSLNASLSDFAIVSFPTSTSDLAVTKSVSDPTPNVGDIITYTVNLTNKGPNNATGVSVSDALPVGLSFVSAAPAQGTYSSVTGIWSVGALNIGASASLLLRARVDSSNASTNTATIAAADQFDPNQANNTASATETPQQADLKITKTVSNANPNVGDNITYLVTLTDLGPNFATGVTVQDSLPAGLTFVSATPSQGIYNPISGQWTVGVVDPSTPRTLAIVATVVSSLAQTNTATASGTQFDPVTTNNTASATETPQQADLVVTKTVSDATPNVGETITFTVTVQNNGPNSAVNVRVNDLLPTGLVYIANTASQGNYFSTTGTWTVGILNNRDQATLTLTAQVVSPTRQTNTATATADQFDPNSGNNSQSVTETPQQADLAITKTVNDNNPNVGDNVTFTITATNNGPNSATNVTVQELLGSGLAFVSDIPSLGTYDPISGVWTVGTVGLIGAPTLLIVARATTSDVVTNTASIKHSDQFDPVSSNNSASIAVKGSQADLAVTKTVDKSTANVGDTVTFTITVTNLNGSACHDVEVTDQLPAGLQFVSDSTTDGTYNNVTGIWALAGNLTNGKSETLTIEATMLTTTTQTNTATITFSDRPDPDIGNNSDSATVNPSTADLVISKAVNDPNPNVGANITYTIRVTDSGPDTATNVTVEDTLPAGLTYVSSSASQGSYDPVSGQWTVGTVNVGTPQTLAIICTVTRLLPGPNTASISHSDQFDPVTANNSDSASISPLSADLALTKTVSNPRPNVGDTVAFTVNLTNDGPANATSVTVSDLLPAGLTLVGSDPTQGSYDPATGVWTVGTLVSSATVTLTLDALVVSSAAQTNTATISHSDQFDPNSGNNSDTATETPQLADLAVSKFVDNATPNVGDTVN